MRIDKRFWSPCPVEGGSKTLMEKIRDPNM